MGEKFPKVEGGGSLILAWQVRNKKVVVIGGGEVRHVLMNPQRGKSINTHHRSQLDVF